MEEELEEVKKRLARLEEAVFGMDYETAEAVVDSYIAAVKENPDTKASRHVLEAERLLGV